MYIRDEDKASILLSPEAIIENDAAEKKVCLDANKKILGWPIVSTHVENYLRYDAVHHSANRVLHCGSKALLSVIKVWHQKHYFLHFLVTFLASVCWNVQASVQKFLTADDCLDDYEVKRHQIKEHHDGEARQQKREERKHCVVHRRDER